MGSPYMSEIYGLKKALKEERKDKKKKKKKKSKQDDWVQATDIWYVGYKWDCIRYLGFNHVCRGANQAAPCWPNMHNMEKL